MDGSLAVHLDRNRGRLLLNCDSMGSSHVLRPRPLVLAA
jgi:hypothetical protein